MEHRDSSLGSEGAGAGDIGANYTPVTAPSSVRRTVSNTGLGNIAWLIKPRFHLQLST
jgi:hypothetical protein